MNNARIHINYMTEAKEDFTLTSSNYTTQIETLENKWKYVANIQSNRTFAAFAKIKSDLKGKIIPNIDRNDLIYFQHDFKESMYIESVINVDIKSAYATVLRNDGFISEKTFKYLQKATKPERLASVGMLASKKEIFEFKSGIPISAEEKISENSGLFFHAVQRTYEVMSELKKICERNYLYTWVDGIYFLPNDNSRFRCINYLSDLNFKYSVDVLEEFEVKVKPESILVTFKKDGKRKVFNLPSPTSEFKRIIIDTIIQMNNQQSSGIKKLSKKLSINNNFFVNTNNLKKKR